MDVPLHRVIWTIRMVSGLLREVGALCTIQCTMNQQKEGTAMKVSGMGPVARMLFRALALTA